MISVFIFYVFSGRCAASWISLLYDIAWARCLRDSLHVCGSAWGYCFHVLPVHVSHALWGCFMGSRAIISLSGCRQGDLGRYGWSQIAKLMGPTWDPLGSCRPQMGPMLAPWTLLSGIASKKDRMRPLWDMLYLQVHSQLRKFYSHV